MRSIVLAAGLALAAGAFSAASAQTKWDFSIAWPPGNFHTQNAMALAAAVKERSRDAVNIVVHPGGSLGLKGPETLRAVRDGIVPIAEMGMSQQAGDAPFLALETLPFLIQDYAELRAFHQFFRPKVEEILARHNQKLIYVVPWPSQMIYTKKPVAAVADLKGLKIRTTDKNSSDMAQLLGMAPVQMPFSDLIPALASGAVNAVATSAPTGVDAKFWEFMTHAYQTNHLWSSNMATVNLAAWGKLAPEQRKLIEDTARELEPRFWSNAEAADTQGQKTLTERGLKIERVAKSMRDEMAATTKKMTEDFVARVGGPSKEVVEAYLKKVGR
jgi:TRAP-type C4-dicarboxylate transport system substrate-binding protein